MGKILKLKIFEKCLRAKREEVDCGFFLHFGKTFVSFDEDFFFGTK